MMSSEVTALDFVHRFRQDTKAVAANHGGEIGSEVERLEIREAGECAVEAWSPDGRDFLTQYWLDETFYRLLVDRPTIVAEANGVWRAAW
jgi:hypothetical protein